jgi:hypothetical protein
MEGAKRASAAELPRTSGQHPPKVWQRSVPLGEPEAVRGLGGIVAPLLAGFSLAALATITTAGDKPPLADWAIAGLALASAFLLFAMQFTFMALRYGASPSERLAVNPRATKSRTALQEERELQGLDFAASKWYASRAGGLYDLGLLCFLVGLALLLVPSEWTVGTAVAVTITGIAAVAEMLWASGRWLRRLAWLSPLYRSLLPLRKDLVVKDSPDELDEIALTAIIGNHGED